eukprot:TRINITY_DN934_c0_g3_i1.p1 TRINITY_DN934_c0_g3~~TRINITY_DN934_c0_g3_i1.p1  ORF type:complete len:501 (+),score=93.14 TRINITY_DN934_c0_g3_i1:51-1553(+)
MRTSTPVQPFKRPDLQKASSVRRDTASSLRSGRFPVQESVHRSKDVNYASNGVTLTDKAPLAYRMIRFFLLLVLNTFFRDIEIIGLENVPLTGGAIIAGNHFNQFVDAMLLIACCPRILSFLMAAKSFQRAVIGWFAKKLQAIPVIRPQDSAVSGKGTITVSGNIVQGTDSSFQSQAENGGSIMIPSVDLPCKIKKITSDTEILLEEDIGQVESTSYKILKKVDQKQLYDAVYNSLSNGGCIGIFPEGGSHDRTDLLPLKAGIAVMALGFVEAHRREVSIIPCGFTYFEGHRFRSQVVVEFGQPIVVNPESDYAKKYSTDRKGAYTNLLEATRKGMESVTVTASSYDDLSAFHLARRLYQSGTNAYMTPFERAFLTRVFLNAYKSEETHEEMEAFKKKLLEFKQYIKNLGFEPHQIKEFTEGTCYLVTALMLRSLLSVVLLLISIPGFVISSPIYFLAIFLSLKEMRHAKATSNVKVKGKDVVSSSKAMNKKSLTLRHGR